MLRQYISLPERPDMTGMGSSRLQCFRPIRPKLDFVGQKHCTIALARAFLRSDACDAVLQKKLTEATALYRDALRLLSDDYQTNDRSACRRAGLSGVVAAVSDVL